MVRASTIAAALVLLSCGGGEELDGGAGLDGGPPLSVDASRAMSCRDGCDDGLVCCGPTECGRCVREGTDVDCPESCEVLDAGRALDAEPADAGPGASCGSTSCGPGTVCCGPVECGFCVPEDSGAFCGFECEVDGGAPDAGRTLRCSPGGEDECGEDLSCECCGESIGPTRCFCTTTCDGNDDCTSVARPVCQPVPPGPSGICRPTSLVCD